MSKAMSEAGRALGRGGAGKPKRYSEAELVRRTQLLKRAREAGIAKRAAVKRERAAREERDRKVWTAAELIERCGLRDLHGR